MKDRKLAKWIGWLFVAATAAGSASVLAMQSTLTSDNILEAVAENQNAILIGSVLWFLMLVAMAGTAALLYVYLKKHSDLWAANYLVARVLEIAVLLVGLVGSILLIPLSWDYIASGAADSASLLALGDTLNRMGEWGGYLGAQMVFSLSALVLNYTFFKYKLLPKWLAVWGLIGVPLMFASGLLPMIESLSEYSGDINLLVIPLAIQEMVMAVWMIAKGFKK